ncbi:MAG: DUF2442 domain-containing protein [Chloroflexi bacterium]|nr:DUF2442 domain-containing protein [Chloroflexota bacterium]
MICVRAVKPLAGFKVHVTFTDGTQRVIDLTPYIGTGPVFAPIRNDPALFRRVFVDPETETLTWENGADIAPETLYYDGDPPWVKDARPAKLVRRRTAAKKKSLASRRQTHRTRARARTA